MTRVENEWAMPSSAATASDETGLDRKWTSTTRRSILKGSTGAVAAGLIGRLAFVPAMAQPTRIVDTCVVLCRFRDAAGNLTPLPANPDFYRQYFFARGTQGLSDYVPEITNGHLELRGDVFGWFDIGHSLAEHNNLAGQQQRQRAYQWGIDAARANGVQVGSFGHRVVFVNSNSDAGGVEQGVSMLIAHGPGALFNHTFMQHEFGHVLGLEHSWSTPPDTAYGDDYCIMSAFTTPYEFQTTILGVTSSAGPRPNAVYVDQLGGFGPGQVSDLVPSPAPQQVRLTALNRSDLGGILAARIPPKGRRKNTYWIELRHPSNWDAGITRPSIAVHEARPGERRSFLIIGPTAKALRNSGDQVVTPDQNLTVRLDGIEQDGLHATISLKDEGTTYSRIGSAAILSGQLNAGELQLLPLDQNGRLWHTIRRGDGSWPFGWGDVQGTIPGGGVGSVQAVSCAIGHNGELHLLVIDQNGGLWHTIRRADGSWPFAWGDVLEAIRAGGNPDVGPVKAVACAASASGQLNAGEMQLLVLDQNGGLRHTIRRADGSWPFGWGDVQGTIPGGGVGSVQAVSCAIGHNGELHLLVIDQNGGLWHTIRRADGSWPFAWGDVLEAIRAGGNPDVGPVKAVACAASASGQLNAGEMQLLVLDQNGGLRHTIRRADGSWPFGWGDVQGTIPGGGVGSVQAVSCAIGHNGELHLLVIDQNGGLWHTIRRADGSWPFAWGDVEAVVDP